MASFYKDTKRPDKVKSNTCILSFFYGSCNFSHKNRSEYEAVVAYNHNQIELAFASTVAKKPSYDV